MSDKEKNRKEKIIEIIEKYRLAGQISKEAKELVKKIVVPGAKAYDICESVEDLIKSKGALPAFPTNISINYEAAHYSAEILDDRTIPQNSIIKMDLGAQIDGYIVDTAITINHNPKLEQLNESSRVALDKAIEGIKPGLKVTEIGKIIEKTITDYGFQPIRNLSGHQIKRYILHAGVSVPNCGPGYLERDNNKFELGRIYALEPFASTGKGWIKNGPKMNIFRFIRQPTRKQKDLVPIYNNYYKMVGVLPFSPRQLHDKSTGIEGKKEIMMNIRKLLRANLIMGYPVLVEDTKHMVSQYEHTVRITRDGCELLT